MAKAKDEQKLTYEQAISQLEAIVKQMEAGTLSLSDSISAYEEGIKLVKYCEKELGKYEKLISDLNKKPGAGSDDSEEAF